MPISGRIARSGSPSRSPPKTPIAPTLSLSLPNGPRNCTLAPPYGVSSPSGSDDITTPIDPNVDDPWDLGASEQAARVELIGAEHESFTDVCNMVAKLPEIETVAPFVVEALEARTEAGCDPDDLAIERVEDLTQTFAVSFLDAVFKGGAMIDDDAVMLPDDAIYDDRGF